MIIYDYGTYLHDLADMSTRALRKLQRERDLKLTEVHDDANGVDDNGKETYATSEQQRSAKAFTAIGVVNPFDLVSIIRLGLTVIIVNLRRAPIGAGKKFLTDPTCFLFLFGNL